MSALYMTDAQYLKIMNNLKAFVNSGAKLSGFDDNTIGDKDTQCTWGLCGDNVKVYPDADMHLWPKDFPKRIAPKYLQNHHRCPFENPNAKDQISGCFYRCRFFQEAQRSNISGWNQWWEEALKWAGQWEEE